MWFWLYLIATTWAIAPANFHTDNGLREVCAGDPPMLCLVYVDQAPKTEPSPWLPEKRRQR